MNKLFTFFRESQTARFLIPAGLMLTIFGVIVFISSLNNQNYVRVEATVTDVTMEQEVRTDSDGNYIEEIYNVTLSYEVDGKEYTGELSNVNKYKKGDKMTIYYDPENPENITQSKSLALPAVLIVAGVASLVGGIFSGVNAIKKHKRMKEQEKEWSK